MPKAIEKKSKVRSQSVPGRQLKVRKIGNSLGMLLSKEAVIEMQVEDGSNLYLSKSPEGRFYLTASDPDFERSMAIARDLMRRYKDSFRELAK